jgi:hypothetical protein
MEHLNWTREEFKAYLLLYAATANYFETEEEKEIILSMVSADAYRRIHRELDKDNDFQRIEKIQYHLKKFGYTLDGVDRLLTDINRVFDSNEEQNEMNVTMQRALRRLLHACV